MISLRLHLSYQWCTNCSRRTIRAVDTCENFKKYTFTCYVLCW